MSATDKPRRPRGVTGICIFFGAGALICFATMAALLFPGSPMEVLWRTKAQARGEFASLGVWGIVLMAVVGAALAAAASGLWRGRRWGHRLGVGVLAVNVASDAVNAVVRQPIAALGVVVGGALIVYLVRSRDVRRFVAAGR